MTRAVVGLVLMTAVAGCSGQPAATTGGAAIGTTTSSACMDAMADAAGVDKMADSVSDLYPAIRACTSLPEWQAAFDANNGAGFSGAAKEVLTNACLAPEVKDEPLCATVK